MNSGQSGEWARIREELHKVTVERDRAEAKLLEIKHVLEQQNLYDRIELIEELKGILE
jgi:hypothetical protein